MPLNKQELEWLERRKNLCNRCVKAAWFRTGKKHGYNTEQCRFWELKVPNRGVLLGSLTENFRDAAEFEACVAAKLSEYCSDYWQYESAWHAIKHARIAVEAEMEAGK